MFFAISIVEKSLPTVSIGTVKAIVNFINIYRSDMFHRSYSLSYLLGVSVPDKENQEL